jgi:hypothetical protein
MLHRPILSRRIGEWAYTLIHCGLALEPLSTLKSQILSICLLSMELI